MTTTLWARSGAPEWKLGKAALAIGAKTLFYRANTTTPLTVYRDADATTPHDTSSLLTDAHGRWPEVHIAYGAYDYRVLDSDDTIIFVATNVQNPAPVDPTSVDTNSLLKTGDVWWSPISGSRDGAVRCNGRSIGSGASSASERANNDTEALFTFLWNHLADAQAAVPGGRGASAAADWAANKTIALPDMRGGGPVGLDDMGNSAASSYADVFFANGDSTTAGSFAGTNAQTVDTDNIKAHTHTLGSLTVDTESNHTHGPGTLVLSTTGDHQHTGSTAVESAHAHTITAVSANQGPITVQSGSGSTIVQPGSPSAIGTASTSGHFHSFTSDVVGDHTHTLSGTSAAGDAHTHSLSGALANAGGGGNHPNLPRSVLGTWYIRL